MINNRLESSIEARVVKFARDNGWLVRKMNGLGNAGWPDRMLISPTGLVVFAEFKRPGGELSPVQRAVINKLTLHRQQVYIIDNVSSGIDLITGLME